MRTYKPREAQRKEVVGPCPDCRGTGRQGPDRLAVLGPTENCFRCRGEGMVRQDCRECSGPTIPGAAYCVVTDMVVRVDDCPGLKRMVEAWEGEG